MRNKLTLLLGLCFALPVHAEIGVETMSISHGVRAWYSADDRVPVVDVRLSFEGAGATSDPSDHHGRAAFAAAMLTEGAGNLDASAYQRALDEKAITIEARTDNDRLVIHVRCLREHALRAGELLAMALKEPRLADPDMQRIKGQFYSLFAQMEEDPGYQAGQLLAQKAFAGHPYANPPYGTAADINAMGAQDVRDYLNTYVTRSNVRIAAAGDVNARLLDAMLEPVVEALAENDNGTVAVAQTTLQGAGTTERKVMDVPQTVVMFAGPSVLRDDPKFYTAYLLSQILGGGTLTSRLVQEVRVEKGLVYSINTSLQTRRGAALISGALATRNSSTEAAIAQVKATLTDLRDKGVTTEECNDAKNYVLGAFPLEMDNSQSLSNMLLVMQIDKLGEDYMDTRRDKFNAVSCADISTLAHEMLDPNRFLFAVVGGQATAQDSAPIPQPSAATGRDFR